MSAAAAATGGNRREMLAKVHIAAKQLGLQGDAYGDVLERVAGVQSAKTLDDRQLAAVLDEFRRLGWRGASPRRKLSQKAQVRMIYGLWRDLAPYVEHHTPEALRAFVRRQTKSQLHPEGVAAAEFLDSKQATLVIEGLKAWLARARREARPSR